MCLDVEDFFLGILAFFVEVEAPGVGLTLPRVFIVFVMLFGFRRSGQNFYEIRRNIKNEERGSAKILIRIEGRVVLRKN